VNFSLKEYLLRIKSEAIQAGYSLRIDESEMDTVSLVSNPKSNKVGMALISPNIFGDLKIRTFLINQRKYQWAKDEGFSLDEMIELKGEGVFLEVDPRKMVNFLL